MSGNRFKQGRAIFLAAIMVISMAAVGFAGSAAAQAANADIVVDDSGGADHTTIQAAVDAAEPGNTIYVEPGDYTESVTIVENSNGDRLDGLTIEGPNAGTPGDSADRGTEASIDGPLLIGANDVTVDGLRIRDVDANSGGSLPGPGAVQLAMGGGYGDTADGATVKNNILVGGTNDNNQNFVFAVESAVGVTVTQNLFTEGDYSASSFGVFTSPTEVERTSNTQETSSQFTSDTPVDTAAPSVSSVQITDATNDDSTVGEDDEVTVSADVTDASDVGTGVDTVEADASAFGAGTVTLTQDEGSTYTATFTVSSESSATTGDQSVTVSATDTAGNGGSRAVSSGDLTVDLGDISGEVVNPAGNGLDSDGTTYTVNLESVNSDDVDTSTTTSTDSDDGSYSFQGLDDGTYNVSITQDGYSDYQEVTIDNSEDIDSVDLTIGPEVTVTPEEVIAGSTETIAADITIASGDSVNYGIGIADLPAAGQGPTTSDFSIVNSFDNADNYQVIVESTTNNDLEATATVSSRYDANITVDPANPEQTGSVSVTGDLTNADGDGADSVKIDFVGPDSDTTLIDDIATTNSGPFAFSRTVDDAGTWNITNDDQSIVYESIEVSPSEANVTLDTSGSNSAGFQETYTVSAEAEDGSELPFDVRADDGDGFVNVTGPFSNVADGGGSIATGTVADVGYADGSTDTSLPVDSDKTIEYLRIDPDTGSDDDGNTVDTIVFSATPADTDSTVTAELSNDAEMEYAGVEDTGDGGDSPTQPDFVGSASVDVTQAGDLTVNVGGDTGSLDVDASDQTVNVEVLGNDGAIADGTSTDINDPSNDLANATVSVTGPGVDLEGTYEENEAGDGMTLTSESDDVSFDSTTDNEFDFDNLNFEEAGTLTVEVVATADDGSEYTDTENFSVAGDNLVSVSPTNADVTSNHDVTVEVTNDEGEPVNNRVVALSGGDFKVNTSSGNLETYTNVVIDGSSGAVYATDSVDDYTNDATLNSEFSANNGVYVAENVSFETTGDLDVDVHRSGDTDLNNDDVAQTIDKTPITVQGIESYDVQTDIDPALAGQTETHNLTVTQNGAEVNGTDLQGLTIEATQSGTDVTETGLTYEDFDDDGTAETVQVDVLPDQTPSDAVNISINPGGAETGSAALEVEEPEISTTLDGDLTEGVTTESVDITALDPRDDSEVDATNIRFNATNATFEVDVDGPANISDEDGDSLPETIKNATDSGFGNVTANITPDAVDDSATLTVSASIDSSQFYGDTDLTAGELQFFERENRQDVEVNDQVPSEFNETVRYNLRDANGERIDERDVAFDDETLTTTNGIISVDYSTVDNGEYDFNVRNDRDGVTDITVGSVDKAEQVALDIEIDGESVENLTVESGEEVDAQLIRTDINDFASGNLLVEQDGTVEQRISIAGDDGETAQLNVSGGNYDLIGQKNTTENTNFANDTIDLTVNQDEASVTFNDDTVTNGSETVDVDSANYELADGSAGDYVVVAHVVNDDSSISDPVGYSENVSGSADEITVDLNASEAQGDALDTLTANTTLRAMLHETSSDGAFGPSLGLATDDANITVEETVQPDPANFEVSGLEPQDATVNVSEAFDVSATVENTGDLQGEQDIELRLEPEGDAVLNETVALNAGNSTTVTFDAAVDTAGEYNHTVASANSSVTGTLTVEEDAPAYYTLKFSNSIADRPAQTTTISTFSTYRQSGSTALLPHNVYRYTRTHTGGLR